MLNIHKLTKTEVVALAAAKCRHGHSYLDHPKCYETEAPDILGRPRHIGYFDIESTHLKANLGYMSCYKIWDPDNNLMLGRALQSKEITSFTFDKALLQELSRDLVKFTHLVGFYCRDRRHDFPFVRTRNLILKQSFPEYGKFQVIDLYDIAKNKLSLYSYRLQVVCDALGVPSKGHPLVGDIWIKSAVGHQPSLDYISIHCEEDVRCLPPVLEILEPYYRRVRGSV